MDSHTAAYPQAVSNLRTSTEPLVELLRIKNQVIGYEDKKQAWVDAGLVLVLAGLLEHSQDDVRLQTTVILASLAQGPSPCTFALLKPAILDPVSRAITVGHPTGLRQASLQMLETLATICCSPHLCRRAPYSNIFSLLRTGPVITALTGSISPNEAGFGDTRTSRIALKLILRTCFLERFQNLYAHGPVLQFLSDRLAKYLSGSGAEDSPVTHHVVQAHRSHTLHTLQAKRSTQAAGRRASILPYLETIAAIIRDSADRAFKLLQSPALVDLSASLQSPGASSGHTRSASDLALDAEFEAASLLPRLPTCSTPNKRNASQIGRTSVIGSDWPGLTPSADQHYQERPIVLLLIATARENSGLVRLLLLQILIALYRADTMDQTGTCRCREKRMEVFVIPMLMRLLEEAIDTDAKVSHPPVPDLQAIQEIAPTVLAMLLNNSCKLANSAVLSPASAITRIAKLLHVSFQPPREAAIPAPWSPLPGSSSGSFELLSPPLLSGEAIHKLRTRESTLKALAALIHEERHRTEFFQTNVSGLVVEALKPVLYLPSLRANPSSSNSSTKGAKERPSIQISSPPSILTAACACVRALSRSVAFSRKELADAGVAKPVLDLMQHEDIDVQIMATQTMANLLLNFSSVRDFLTKEGVIKVLGSQLRSPHTRLRLEALFALCNLIYDNAIDTRLLILEACNIDYIIKILTSLDDDGVVGPEQMAQIVMDGVTRQAVAGSGSNGAGMDGAAEDCGRAMDDSIGLLSQEPVRSKQQHLENGAKPVYAVERRHVHQLSIDMQEQALIMIRHFFTPPDASTLFDKFIDHLSIPRFFEILASKLRPLPQPAPLDPLDPASSFDSISTYLSTDYAEPRILSSTIKILVHISACEPRHRAILMHQSEFLRSLQPLLKHGDREVRQSILYLVCQLTHDRQDEEVAFVRSRARTFRQWGWLPDLDRLEKGFPGEEVRDVDQRERARQAIHQVKGMVSG